MDLLSEVFSDRAVAGFAGAALLLGCIFVADMAGESRQYKIRNLKYMLIPALILVGIFIFGFNSSPDARGIAIVSSLVAVSVWVATYLISTWRRNQKNR
jgi:hypothetical protein